MSRCRSLPSCGGRTVSSETARAARDRVLDRIAAAGVAPRDEIARAKTQSVPHERKQLPMLAPHAADQVVLHEPDNRVHGLTIDLPLQKSLQDLAFERARTLGPDISVAVLAVDNASAEVRARVASADYSDTRRAGQVDMTQALRPPCSTRHRAEPAYPAAWSEIMGVCSYLLIVGTGGRSKGKIAAIKAFIYHADRPTCRCLFGYLRR